ncbi:hypothetical protein RHMOL_Rhmol08G0206900 [Rhododendron molle]|uniref:Uncharacterized protein n=1 Tax=Rhododendron molle TaxID=49168 RepID=A0ACC0MS51_RHOML|nr:hypothetical protein RHMOL_Rhmol08G0206900 [Rhododendron molle]
MAGEFVDLDNFTHPSFASSNTAMDGEFVSKTHFDLNEFPLEASMEEVLVESEHIFWSPTPCFDWYQKYGDVVVFDTTYKVNAYDMPFGIFVGVNNHGKTVLFGCALLRNETTNAFRWLMKTFTCLMKKPPKTILTDQDPWMTEAISKELPFTKHAFCIWHITAKFSGWFTTILRNQYSNWCMDFYKLYKLDSCDDFERQWLQVIAKYDMAMNKHVNGLYRIKHFWAPCYLRGHFFGGMTTMGRSESINAFIKRFVTAHVSLIEFVKQIDLSIEDVEQTQSHDTMLETYRGSSLRTLSPLEEQAHSILTPYAFKMFQEEFGRATQYSVLAESGGEFVLRYYKDKCSQKHKVLWDGEKATCTCKHFEFWGILCRHILSIFLHKDCYQIPPAYLLPRWCREALLSGKEGEIALLNDPNLVAMENIEIEDNVHDGIDIDCFVDCPPISKTKGRPKQKRMKGGKELGKRKKHCGLCKHAGHNISTCPEKENATFSNGANIRKKMTSTTVELNSVFCLKY